MLELYLSNRWYQTRSNSLKNAVSTVVKTGVCSVCQDTAPVELVRSRVGTEMLLMSLEPVTAEDFEDSGDYLMDQHKVGNTDIPCRGDGTTPQFLG